MSKARPGRKSPTIHRGPDHSAPYPVSRLAPGFELVDLAREIEAADATLASHASGKLKLIAEQIRTLQEQAREILEQTRRDQALHRAACAFRRQPGKIYHLYRKPDGSTYFSLLAPEDWSGRPPHDFLGSWRLENDMSWSPADALDQPPDDDMARLLRMLDE